MGACARAEDVLSRSVRAWTSARVAVAGASFLRPTFCRWVRKASSPFGFLAFVRTILGWKGGRRGLRESERKEEEGGKDEGVRPYREDAQTDKAKREREIVRETAWHLLFSFPYLSFFLSSGVSVR